MIQKQLLAWWCGCSESVCNLGHCAAAFRVGWCVCFLFNCLFLHVLVMYISDVFVCIPLENEELISKGVV